MQDIAHLNTFLFALLACSSFFSVVFSRLLTFCDHLCGPRLLHPLQVTGLFRWRVAQCRVHFPQPLIVRLRF